MPDKEEIKRNFSRSAPEYDRHAVLQAKMADKLFAAVRGLNPERILDIGCGTGYLTRRLAENFPRAKVLGIDIAPGMIEVAKEKEGGDNLVFRVGDGENLLFDKRSFDLVVSNASLQWMDAGKTARQVRRVLRPGGHFVFTTFGPQTLRELGEAGFRVNKYLSAGEMEKRLKKEKFKPIFCEARVKRQKFDSLSALILYLKKIGARSRVKGAKPDGRVLKSYRKGESPLKVSFEVITGHFTAFE
ncbi:methyltransferase domain-containing protein [Candidatus Saganbacteria bacterium]|uniref:Malonyl-[acyl-carrier protein] O-methyltransferase n=1 Tax=Candidatus Saganbacteria bacterium TaxID=2575572 RepID=A0A9D6YVY5_UNCSA|nr:methyltransferase domain-containing protein [Candidatus Saganbacteria bacterium]